MTARFYTDFLTFDERVFWAQVNMDPIADFRKRLLKRLPDAAAMPPQPKWKPKDSNNPDTDVEVWKDKNFDKHPNADANKTES